MDYFEPISQDWANRVRTIAGEIGEMLDRSGKQWEIEANYHSPMIEIRAHPELTDEEFLEIRDRYKNGTPTPMAIYSAILNDSCETRRFSAKNPQLDPHVRRTEELYR